ncbi:MAG: hypothetical protein IPL54_16075 [Chitinophagaceae bacterium]|nr:hypothetical protein [Chitinophagaceae bacterium]
MKLDLVVKRSALTFALPIKKGVLFKGKEAKKKAKKTQINFGDKIKTPTFALPIKKGAKSKVIKFFESLETAANN